MPAASGVSGPTTTNSIAFALAEIDHRCMVGDVEVDAFGFARDAGVARGAPEFRHQRRSRDLPRESVFAAAGTEQENVHEMQPASRFSKMSVARVRPSLQGECPDQMRHSGTARRRADPE